ANSTNSKPMRSIGFSKRSVIAILLVPAPRSARIIPHVGPITICVNSTTRMPSRGRLFREVLGFPPKEAKRLLADADAQIDESIRHGDRRHAEQCDDRRERNDQDRVG